MTAIPRDPMASSVSAGIEFICYIAKQNTHLQKKILFSNKYCQVAQQPTFLKTILCFQRLYWYMIPEKHIWAVTGFALLCKLTHLRFSMVCTWQGFSSLWISFYHIRHFSFFLNHQSRCHKTNVVKHSGGKISNCFHLDYKNKLKGKSSRWNRWKK